MYIVEEDRFNLKPRAGVLHCADIAMSVDDLAENAQFIKGMNLPKPFHLANGHPSKDRMRIILTHGLVDVDDPGYTLADLDAWDGPCHGFEMARWRRPSDTPAGFYSYLWILSA